VISVLRGPRLSLGPKMEEFEELAAGTPVRALDRVSSGTAGLHLCIRALGIGAGDEVIVPSFTFVAAANAVRYEGAPLYSWISSRDISTSILAVLRLQITPRTRAIVVVHTLATLQTCRRSSRLPIAMGFG